MPYSHPQPIDKSTVYRNWKHILPGAIGLAGIAGYVNSVLLGFFDTPVSHMSGAVSRLGLNISIGHSIDAVNSIFIILGFLFGAMLVGILVGATQLLPSKIYGLVLLLEGALLTISTYLLVHRAPGGSVVAAIACGLQNAMSSSYCGLMIRTTHVSGVVTDLGVMLGHWLRHRRIVTWKLKFILGLLFAFGSGGMAGAYLDLLYGPICLLIAAGFSTIGGLVFFILVHFQGDDSNPITQEHAVPRTSIFPMDEEA